MVLFLKFIFLKLLNCFLRVLQIGFLMRNVQILFVFFIGLMLLKCFGQRIFLMQQVFVIVVLRLVLQKLNGSSLYILFFFRVFSVLQKFGFFLQLLRIIFKLFLLMKRQFGFFLRSYFLLMVFQLGLREEVMLVRFSILKGVQLLQVFFILWVFL